MEVEMDKAQSNHQTDGKLT